MNVGPGDGKAAMESYLKVSGIMEHVK